MAESLVARLRERLITLPKPDSKPFEPTYPIVHTWTPGEKHKPGDSAGLQMVNVNLTAASSVPSKLMAQEFVYAPSPLEWEAAAEIERLWAALERISQDEFDDHGKDDDWESGYWRVINLARTTLAGSAVETFGELPREQK